MKTKRYSLLVLLIFFFGVSSLWAEQSEQYVFNEHFGSSQEVEKKVSLEDHLQKIETGYNVVFLYESKLVNGKFSSLQKLEGTLREKIEKILEPHNLVSNYIDNRTFVISRIPETELDVAADTVTGVVTDQETNETLPGVNILVKGTTRGTSTDTEGRYTLRSVEPQDTLLFSFIGYQTQEVPIDGREEINIALEPQVFEAGEEIVVVGYGTQQRRNVSGSISSVSSDDLDEAPVQRLDDALQGRLSGVRVTSSSGAPGSSSSVRIRGTTSINNSDPLYIVDGVPIENGGIGYLNPGDIESIQVLKDAASAAIYGTRAASGVVLVTTKGGSRSDFEAS